MSVVTSLVLACDSGEQDSLLISLDAYLRKCNRGWSLGFDHTDCGHTGGTKRPQIRLFTAGLNGAGEDDASDLIEFIRRCPWELPENVILILYPEDEEPCVERFA